MTSPTIKHSKQIWDYLASFNKPEKSDAIVVCCSYDLRICDYACELLKASVAPKIVFSGNTGNWTNHLWDRPESQIFKERAESNGISSSKLFIEPNSTNIGENIAFSRQVLPKVNTVTFVTKPNTILRVRLSVPLKWPRITAHTASPLFSFPSEVSNIVGLFGVINEMVGDIQRIIEYPKLGYQVKHTLPEEVLESWEYLIHCGFTQHMMKANNTQHSSVK